MKYLIYTRVSERGSDWTGETSCEAQMQECQRYVRALNPRAAFVPEIREEFKSGTTLKKRKLAIILDEAVQGRAEWDVLVALDLDRLFRSTEECLASFRQLAEAKKGVILVRQNIDLSSPYGQFTLTVLAAVAQLTAQIGSQKTKDKMNYIARQGLWPCKCPMGYKRAAPKNNLLVIDPESAAIVRDMYLMAGAGQGPVAIARKHGLPKNTVNKILANPLYTGRLVYGEINVEGKHEAIIDPGTWQAAQRVVSRHAPRPAKQAYPYKLTGTVRCGCGKAMSPATCRGAGGRYPYYRCQDANCSYPYRYVRADLLEQAILNEVAGYCYSDEACARLADRVARHHLAIIAAESPELKRLDLALRAAKQESDRLIGALHGAEVGGLLGANKAILEALDVKTREMEGIERQVVTIRERLAHHAQAEDPKELAEMWQGTARVLAEGKADTKLQTDWLRAHVVEIASVGREWRVKLNAVSSTPRTLWHPQGESNPS